MAAIDDIQEIMDALLIHDLNRIVELGYLADAPDEQNHQPFHPFNNEDDIRSEKLATEWWDIVQTEPGDQGLDSLRDAIIEAVRTQSSGLVNDAAKTFIVHHGADVGLTLRHFLHRHPYLAKRSADRQITGPEDVLNWFREDIFLNEHHEHWHNVYQMPRVQPLPNGDPALYLSVAVSDEKGGRQTVYNLPFGERTLMGIYVSNNNMYKNWFTRQENDEYAIEIEAGSGDIAYSGAGQLEVLDERIGFGRINMTSNNSDSNMPKGIWIGWSCIQV